MKTEFFIPHPEFDQFGPFDFPCRLMIGDIIDFSNDYFWINYPEMDQNARVWLEETDLFVSSITIANDKHIGWYQYVVLLEKGCQNPFE